MAISYPLALPSTAVPCKLTWASESQVGAQRSPWTGEGTFYAHQGEWREVMVELPPMERADAEYWCAFLDALNGQEGSFLMGDPVGASPRGSWASGSPSFCLSGAHAAGVKTLTAKNFSSGATGKAGDWIQIGSGSTARLHKLVQDFTAAANGAATLEIWPRTRAAYSDGQTLVVQAAVGLWRLAANRREWSVGEAQMYGISFAAVEAI